MKLNRKTGRGFDRASFIALIFAWGLLLLITTDVVGELSLGFATRDIPIAATIAAGATFIRVVGLFFIRATGGLDK